VGGDGIRRALQVRQREFLADEILEQGQ